MSGTHYRACWEQENSLGDNLLLKQLLPLKYVQYLEFLELSSGQQNSVAVDNFVSKSNRTIGQDALKELFACSP